jgi:hypothetical protein
VRLAPPLHAGMPRAARTSAVAVLGADHPLVRAIDALTAVARQSLVVAAILAASLPAAASDAGWAPAMAAAAGLVLVALGVMAVLLRQRKREQAVALIAEGREELPIAIVEHERRRLLAGRMRSYLAASLESLVEEAANPPVTAGPPLVGRAVVRAVADDLLEAAALLRDEPSSARGIALVWCLICDGVTSPLHRGEVAELREELGRIRHLLRIGSVGQERAARCAGTTRIQGSGRDEGDAHREAGAAPEASDSGIGPVV